MQRLLVALLFVALLGVGFIVPAETVQGAAAQAGTITLDVQCNAGPDLERTTITNNTDTSLNLSAFRVGSLYQPRSDEPLPLSGSLAPGQSRTFETGRNASTNVLSQRTIYENVNPTEGARLTTPFGSVEVLCSAGSTSLRVMQSGTTTTTTTTMRTATTTTTATMVTGTRTTTAMTSPALPRTGGGGGAGGAMAATLLGLVGLSLVTGAVALRRRVGSDLR